MAPPAAGKVPAPVPALPEPMQPHDTDLGVTEDEVAMLCGAHPGSATAQWLFQIRAQPRRAPGLPPVPSADDVPRRRVTPQVPVLPAVPPSRIDADDESAPRKRNPLTISPEQHPVSPSGLTKASSGSTDKLSSSATSTDLGGDHEVEEKGGSSTGSVSIHITEVPPPLRPDPRRRPSQSLVTQFDELLEQRRLLSVKYKRSPPRHEGDSDKGDSGPTSSASPRAGMRTHVYDEGAPPWVAAAGGELEADQRVIVLSLGPMTPVHRYDYKCYSNAGRPGNGGSEPDTWPDADAGGRPATTAAVPLGHRKDLLPSRIPPAVPTYPPPRSAPTNSHPRRMSRTGLPADTAGGVRAYDGRGATQKRAGRLPPLEY